jgi:hypothetical protein
VDREVMLCSLAELLVYPAETMRFRQMVSSPIA